MFPDVSLTSGALLWVCLDCYVFGHNYVHIGKNLGNTN